MLVCTYLLPVVSLLPTCKLTSRSHLCLLCFATAETCVHDVSLSYVRQQQQQRPWPPPPHKRLACVHGTHLQAAPATNTFRSTRTKPLRSFENWQGLRDGRCDAFIRVCGAARREPAQMLVTAIHTGPGIEHIVGLPPALRVRGAFC